jgi:hypothetical protein
MTDAGSNSPLKVIIMRSLSMKAILWVWLGVMATQVFAQPKVRTEDHFWSKRVVNRISLVEKINRPLIYRESSYFSGDDTFTQNQGMIESLINGLKQGKYLAYHPDEWGKQMTYDEVINRMREFDQALIVEEDVWEEDTNVEEIANESSESEWAIQEDEEWGNDFESNTQPEPQPQPTQQPLDFAPYEEVVHMVEDWIFDRNQSRMIYEIDFFEVIWTDPTGMLPEKVLARFKWDDVKGQLDKTKWKARFNDASARSVREIFDLRIFNSILINVGGEPVTSLMEAARRRQEMVEFEHHLWSY